MNINMVRWFSALLVILPLVSGFAREEVVSTNDEFTAVGRATIQLLQSGDAEAFAAAVTASIEDWQSLASTNAAATNKPPTAKDLKSGVDHEYKVAKESAEHVVEKAKSLHLEATRLKFDLKEVRRPKFEGSFRSERTGNKDERWYEYITIVLSATPITDADKSLAGDYELTLGGMMKLPNGWRSYEGLRWNRFPPSAVDESTEREMKIAAAVSNRQPVSGDDDPALIELGNTILRFLRDADEKVFTNEAMLTIDDIWTRLEKQPKHPSRKELGEHWGEFSERIVSSAHAVLVQTKKWGFDLSSAKLEKVTASRLMHRGAQGSLEDLEARSLSFVFKVDSTKHATSGKPLSGAYVFSSGEAMRVGGKWKIQGPVRWESLPKGVADEKDLAKLQFENYVAEHSMLPPGTMAPDVEFVRLDNEQKEKLADYRGKVLVVDFWATWCGPCQQPMADLQPLMGQHPEWKDKVKIISLSIDDTAAQVQKHLAKKGWTNTFNVWAGPGGWASAPAKAFRVTGVPSTYVIGKDGKIIWGDHPFGTKIEAFVVRALK